MNTRPGLRALAALLTLALALTACGSDEPAVEEDPAATDEPAADAPAEGADEGETVEVTGVDYAFEGAPETAEAGTRLTFVNASEAEAHEMVLFRIPEGEERSVEELLALPDGEGEEAVEFQGVAFAFPGEETMYPEGETVLSEPGRYAIICFVPVGADPEAIRADMAEQSEGPPDMGEGPPHFTRGMVAEITVS